MGKTIFITGAAGFIGSFLSKRLLALNYTVIGIDNMNDYYDVRIKENRLEELVNEINFTFVQQDISVKEEILDLFKKYQPSVVINLAAQAGVRYSIENPDVYMVSNIDGFYNILEACRHYPVEHLIYASSSSVYGNNQKVPFKETDQVDSPVSLYAATKKTNELMAATYNHLYQIPTSGLRFFTVYGPKGRPDMAYFKFTDKYFNDEAIQIYNNGDFTNDLFRDFTFIEDIIEGIIRLMDKAPTNSQGKPEHQIYNIGNSKPVNLMDFINRLEEALSNSLGRKISFKKEFEPMKPGDVTATYASTEKLEAMTGYRPETPISDGLRKFTDWYVDFYNKK